MRFTPFLLIIVFLTFGCGHPKPNPVTVSIFFNPSLSVEKMKDSVAVYLNQKEVAKRVIVNDRTSNYKYITCFTIDKSKRNVLTLKIEYKQKIVDLDKYNSNCINIFTAYDNVLKIKDDFKRKESESISRKGQTLNFNKYFDSVFELNGKGQYDSLICNSQLDKCLCDSAGKGYGF